MQENILKQNKMGTQPTGKLLFSMSLPMIFSMLVMALYNVVDSIFVAKLNEDALSAVSLAFPIQNLMIAISVGIGVGANAVISRSLGERNFERANIAGGNCITLSFLSSLIFVVFGLFFSRAFFQMQTNVDEVINSGANIDRIIDYGVDYMMIVCIGSFPLFGQIAYEKILASTGKTHLTMVMQLIGAIINIVLDPILIFGLFGFPKLEVKGAALATIIGQFVAFLVAILLNKRYNKELVIKASSLKLDMKIVKLIMYIGIPSILMVAITSIMSFVMNNILIKIAVPAMTFFGIYLKLQNFVFMPIFGVNNGMVPIVSYNYGAKNPPRIKSTLIYAMIMSGSIMLAGLLTFQLAPTSLLLLFEASEEMLTIGKIGLRIISLSFIFAGFNIVMSSYCTAVGKSVYSFMMSLFRQLIILIPVAWLFSVKKDVNIIWWAFFIAEIGATLMSVYLLFKVKKLIVANSAQKDNDNISQDTPPESVGQ